MVREWKVEWMKTRYRGIGCIVLAFFGLIVLWSFWALHDIPRSQVEDGFRMLFMQIPLMDTILMPTMIAMLASRLCDAEVKGSTLKLLCTLEKKGRLFDLKLLTGACYLTLFTAGQVGLILAESAFHSFVRPLEPVQLLYFVLQIYTVSLGILLLQVILSFHFENQILPLAAGILGSFVGLFSWYFSDGMLKKCILWGYYSELCFIIMDWDPKTRIVTYYDAPFDWLAFGILLAVLAAGYGAGRWLFLKKEV